MYINRIPRYYIDAQRNGIHFFITIHPGYCQRPSLTFVHTCVLQLARQCHQPTSRYAYRSPPSCFSPIPGVYVPKARARRNTLYVRPTWPPELPFVAHTSPGDTVRHVLLSWQCLHEKILVQVLQLQNLVPHIQNQWIQLPPIITGRLHTTSCRVPTVAYTMSAVCIHDSRFEF